MAFLRDAHDPVQLTNDSSSVSKLSAVEKKYWTDPFLKHFVRKNSRRAPLINRGYYIRLKAVDFAVRHFINKVNCSSAWQFVSYGAGFDTTCFRLMSDDKLKDAVFYEIDFPEVVQRKAEIITNVPELQDLVGQLHGTEIGGSVAVVSSRYRLVAVDLVDVGALESQLREAGIDHSLPSLFLSECVLTYLAPKSSSSVIEWTAKNFHNCMFVTYEQVYPSDGFGRVMIRHFQSRSTPIQGILSYPSPSDQEQRYKSLGFNVSHAFDMNYFYSKILDASERERVLQLEPFDEFEEWHLKCSHYVLIMSVKGMHLTLPVPMMTHIDKSLPDRTETWESFSTAMCVTSAHLQRFGHASATSGDILVFGGYGSDGVRHARLSCPTLLTFDKTGGSFKSSVLPFQDSGLKPQALPSLMFHSLTAMGEGQFLIAGGRGSPLAPSSKFFILRLRCHNRADRLGECWHAGNAFLEWIDLDVHGDPFVPRWRHTASCVSTDSGNRKVIIFGGRTNDCVLGDTIEIDIFTRTVTKLENRGVVPCLRHSHSAAVQNDQMIIISGGLSEDETVLSDIFCLHVSPQDDRKLAMWKNFESIPAIEPRYSHTSHVHHHCLLLIGGVKMGGNGAGGLTIINMNSHVSRSFQLPECNPEKWVLLHKHTSELLLDGAKAMLLIIGGGGTCFSFGTHINCGLFVVQVGREISLCQ